MRIHKKSLVMGAMIGVFIVTDKSGDMGSLIEAVSSTFNISNDEATQLMLKAASILHKQGVSM